MMTVAKFNIVLLLTLLITSCGFQPRGVSHLAGNPTAIELQAPNQVAFTRELIRLLHANNITVQDGSTIELPVLKISQFSYQRNVISVDRRGRAQEYELRLSVHVEYQDAQQNNLVIPFELQIERDFTYSDEQAVGKTGEEEQIKAGMFHDMAQLLIRRLAE